MSWGDWMLIAAVVGAFVVFLSYRPPWVRRPPTPEEEEAAMARRRAAYPGNYAPPAPPSAAEAIGEWLLTVIGSVIGFVFALTILLWLIKTLWRMV